LVEAPPELVCGHEPTSATTEDDRAASRRERSPPRRLLDRGLLVHLPDRIREACLVELVLREDDPAVRADENAPGNPTVGERAEQAAVAVGDHGKLELVLLLPGPARVLGFEGADVDDFEAVAGEVLVEVSNGRRLLPTALSGRFPEDEKQSVRAVDRQAQLCHRHDTSGLDASRESVNDLHLPLTVQML